VAICLFVLQAWLVTGTIPISHEELSTHAAVPPLELKVEGGVARAIDTCGGTSAIVYTGVRPLVVWCAGGLAWPVMIMEYMSGILYWPFQLLRPLHQGDPIAMRRTTLWVGVLTLIVLFLVVERAGGSLRAAATVLVAALQPVFVLLHSLLILFETVPPLLVLSAVLVVVRRADQNLPPTPLRAGIAGALVGLAVLGNVKAVMLVVPLLAFALLESPVLRRTSASAWLAALAAAALAASPMAISALSDPQHRFGNEIGARFAIAAARLDPRLLAVEVFYSVVMAVDPGYFLLGDLWLATLFLPALALAYSLLAVVRALRGLPHDRVAAACGALQLFYVIFVWLAYDQAIHANYAPIVCAQAASMGCLLAAIARRIGTRRRGPVLGFAAAAAIAIVSLSPNTYRRGNPRDLEISVNLDAERALGEHLRQNPDPQVAVTSYNLAGLPDAFSGKPTVRLEEALSVCQSSAEPQRCERDVVIAAIKALPDARFLVALRTTPMDEPAARRMLATMEDAARALGLRLREEARFKTRQAEAVLALIVLEPVRGPQS